MNQSAKQERFLNRIPFERYPEIDFSEVYYKGVDVKLKVVGKYDTHFITPRMLWVGSKLSHRNAINPELFLLRKAEDALKNTNIAVKKVVKNNVTNSDPYVFHLICKYGEFTMGYRTLMVNKKHSLNIRTAKNKKQFLIKMCQEAHNNKYTYEKAIYKNMRTKILVTCKFHGDFPSLPHDHIYKKVGCPKCNTKGGWSHTEWRELGQRSKSFTGYKLYFLKLEFKGNIFLKVGRTFVAIKRRFDRSDINILNKYLVITSDSHFIYKLENKVHLNCSEYNLKSRLNFPGDTECYKLEHKDEIEKIIYEEFNKLTNKN